MKHTTPPSGFTTRLLHPRRDLIAQPNAWQRSMRRSWAASEGDGLPPSAVLEAQLAQLEGAEEGLVTASGLQAVAATLEALVEPGDELVIDEAVHDRRLALLLHRWERYGVQVRRVDLTDSRNLAQVASPNTRVVYIQTPTDPYLRPIDVESIASCTRAHQTIVVVDNTANTPYLYRPLESGANLVIHSTMSYLSGQAAACGGAVLGSSELVGAIRAVGLTETVGAALCEAEAARLSPGLSTLALRMDRHSSSARSIGLWLSSHPRIDRVYFPGSYCGADAALMARQMIRPNGLLTLCLQGGAPATERFVSALQLFVRVGRTPSTFAAVESGPACPVYPVSTVMLGKVPDAAASKAELVLLSVGLEDPMDLIADLKQALEYARARASAVVSLATVAGASAAVVSGPEDACDLKYG